MKERKTEVKARGKMGKERREGRKEGPLSVASPRFSLYSPVSSLSTLPTEGREKRERGVEVERGREGNQKCTLPDWGLRSAVLRMEGR